MNVVITDCNFEPGSPHPVYVELQRLLAAQGVKFSVDNCWSDEYAKADLIIAADPLPDSETILDTRVLGQRTLNRYTRLEVARHVDAPVARFCSPANDDELRREAREWGDAAVLKYDWSMRRNGVFLWPLSQGRRPFPADFKQRSDLFMEFLGGDPLTYKIDAFGGTILGSWILPTRHMRQPDWQVISDANVHWFDPPVETIESIGAVSRYLLGFGAGYVSFDLMRTDEGFKIIEMNSCGVGTSVWKYWPERYAASYAQGISYALANLNAIPRYRELRTRALNENNDAAAVKLKTRFSQQRSSLEPADNSEGADQASGERLFFEELLRSECLSPRRLTKTWQKAAAALLEHARATVPFYKDRLTSITRADGSIDWDRWQEIPLISDKDVAENRDRLLSRNLPPKFGAVAHSSIRSQNGSQITITRSAIQAVVESVIQTRLYHWHQIEPAATMASLLPGDPATGRSSIWNLPWWSPGGGPEYHNTSDMPVVEQLRWLRRLGEVYLRTMPSALGALIQAVQDSPELLPNLKGVVIHAETLLVHADIVTDGLRQLCRSRLGCEIIDSCRRPEAGTIAVRCPSADLYHVQSEACLMEVIDGDGKICEPGQTGEVVITPLYSYAMPLIRYRTGDLAELPSSDFSFTQRCSCGRSLPGIKRFLRGGKPPTNPTTGFGDRLDTDR